MLTLNVDLCSDILYSVGYLKGFHMLRVVIYYGIAVIVLTIYGGQV